MKTLLYCTIWLFLQINTLQTDPVVHLRPHAKTIDEDFGGRTLELIDAPPILYLPPRPPPSVASGAPWSVHVKNLGPRLVSVVHGSSFTVQVNVGQTVIIGSNGSLYSVRH